MPPEACARRSLVQSTRFVINPLLECFLRRDIGGRSVNAAPAWIRRQTEARGGRDGGIKLGIN